MNSSLNDRNFGLDVIRALAISLVVISHCTLLIFPDTTSTIILIIRTFGAVGVDLFFVLSGFLIGGLLIKSLNLNKGTFNDLFTFWKRRWLRTLPNYYLILIVTILISFFLDEELPVHISRYFFFIQNFSSPQPDFFTESWSLSIEEFAYIIVPFLLFIALSFFKKIERLQLFLLVTLIAIVLLFILKLNYFFNTSISSYKYWSATFRKVVIYRMDAIYFGFLIIYLFNQYFEKIQKLKYKLLLIGVGLFSSTHIAIYFFDIFPETNKGFYSFYYLQSVVVSLGLTFPFFYFLNYKGKIQHIIYFISVHSYAIYLINYSVVLLTLRSIFDITNYSIIQKLGVTFLYVVITLLLSKIIYKYFELPILKYRNSKYSR